MIYASQATAADHVFEEYPRIASFGADGRYTFAWNTNPSAPSRFRDAVEFLRQNEADWSAGIIDFTQTPPAISEPAGCRGLSRFAEQAPVGRVVPLAGHRVASGRRPRLRGGGGAPENSTWLPTTNGSRRSTSPHPWSTPASIKRSGISDHPGKRAT